MTSTVPADEPQMENVFSEEDNRAAERNAVGVELARLADEDDRVVAISADMSAVLANLRERHPGRYVELGIAETNTVSVAAGLAAAGLRPYVVSMGPFGAIKCAEQLRTDVAYTMLPVRFIARLSGLAMGFFGPSHHAVEDVAIARSITNLSVVAPADPAATRALLRSTRDLRGPVYYRISEGTGRVYDRPPALEPGRWARLRQGGDVTIVAHGVGVGAAMAAADKLSGEGIAAGVMDAAWLKPFDADAVVEAATTSRAILTVEEHSVVGGLGAIVAETLGRRGLAVPLRTLALPDADLEVGVPAALLELYGLTPDGVVAEVHELLAA